MAVRPWEPYGPPRVTVMPDLIHRLAITLNRSLFGVRHAPPSGPAVPSAGGSAAFEVAEAERV